MRQVLMLLENYGKTSVIPCDVMFCEPGFRFRGARTEAPRVYMGVRYVEGVGPREGVVDFFFIFGSQNAYFDAFSGPFVFAV